MAFYIERWWLQNVYTATCLPRKCPCYSLHRTQKCNIFCQCQFPKTFVQPAVKIIIIVWLLSEKSSTSVPVAVNLQQRVQIVQLLSKGIGNVITRNKCLQQPGREKEWKLRDGHVLLSLIMQPNLWLGLHSALWVIRDHVVFLACWKYALRPNTLLSAFYPPPPFFSLFNLFLPHKKPSMLQNYLASCQGNKQINKHGSHPPGS